MALSGQFSTPGELWVVGVSTIHTEVEGLRGLVPPAPPLGAVLQGYNRAKERIGWETEGGPRIPPSSQTLNAHSEVLRIRTFFALGMVQCQILVV